MTNSSVWEKLIVSNAALRSKMTCKDWSPLSEAMKRSLVAFTSSIFISVLIVELTSTHSMDSGTSLMEGCWTLFNSSHCRWGTGWGAKRQPGGQKHWVMERSLNCSAYACKLCGHLYVHQGKTFKTLGQLGLECEAPCLSSLSKV